MSARIDALIDYTARKFESGPAGYAAFTPDDVGHGVSFGFIQFNQKVGALPALFKLMSQKAPTKFSAVFGAYAPKMLSETWVRNTNLAGDADFVARLKASAQVPEFCQAQRDLARASYFDPVVPALKAAGLKSERAHAMAYDTAVQRGPGTARRLIAQAAAKVPPGTANREKVVLATFAPMADATTNVTTDRRQKMLSDVGLSDAEVVAAGSGLLLLGLGLGAFWWYTRK